MALTQDQIIQIRRQIGKAPADSELQTIYSRVGTVDGLVLEVLQIRLAEMKRNPSAFAVPGEYSESRTPDQMKALEKQVAALASSLGETASGLSQARIVPPARPACR